MHLVTILLLGIFLGPSVLKIDMPDWLSNVSHVAGGVFLFFAGWEIRFLNFKREARFYSTSFIGAFVIPFAVGYLVFSNLFLACAIGISALPVAIQILKEKQRYDSDLGRKTVTLAGLCDLAAWLLMFFMFPASSATEWLSSHWFILAFFAGLVFNLLRPLPKIAFSLQKWLLAPLFFVGLGWRISLFELFDLSTFIKILSVAMVSKILGVYLTARILRQEHRTSIELAMLLNARGAMEIVAAHTAYAAGMIDGAIFTSLVALGVVTSLFAIPFVRHNTKLKSAT